MEENNYTSNRNKLKHPLEKANILSELFFCWLLPYFVKGYKNEITEDDMYGPLKAHESSRLGDKLEAAWNYQVSHKKAPSLLLALIKVFYLEFIIYGILYLVQEFIVKLSQPLLISKFLKYYEPNQTDITKQEVYICAGLIVFFALLNVLIIHGYYFRVMHLGIKIRVATSSLIYRKALKLNRSALKDTTIGQMVNLLSNDVGRFDFAAQYIHNLWIAPIETLVIMYVLYVYVGPTGLTGACFLILFILPQMYLGKKISQYRLNTAQRTDERVRLMSEIITGIQVIKMYTWEKPFAKLVEMSRMTNVEQRKSQVVIRQNTINEINFTTKRYPTDVQVEGSFQNIMDLILTEETSLLIYSILVFASIVLALSRSIFFFRYCMAASTRLHALMFNKIVQAPMRFFNTNPSGRILNRFSKDIGTIDETLPLTAADTIQIAFILLSISIVIGCLNPWILLPTVIIVMIFYGLRLVFLATSRDIKRVEAVTRSPMYTHVAASIQGLTTIRAFGAQEILKREFDNYQNKYVAASFLFLGANRTFGFWLDFHCVIYTAFVLISILFIKSEIFGGNVGFALTEAVGLTGMFQWGIRQWSEMENQMTSVERIQEYIDITPESDETTREAPINFPEEGSIIFEKLSLRYSQDDPYVLNDLSFEIKAKAKIGIVGRTGAGKSSLITAIFRLTDTDGNIFIDHINTREIPLRILRSKISIIPQEPILFSGTLRKNLDPFEEYNDDVLWNALENVELKNVVSDLPSCLECKISEGGFNFSVGQRQLICLARAIVRHNKILILDEATANVDPYTDGLIQTTIREKFADCTVLTIAHRLHTIMDSDKVLVMDEGRAVEFDHPHALLLNPNGFFHKLVQQTGTAMARNLSYKAEEHYNQYLKKYH